MKVGIVTQARIGSTRLPGKILRKIGDETLLDIHFNRLKKAGYSVFMATTFESGIESAIDVAKKHSVIFFQGSTDNVLERYYQCAKQNKLDVIVRVTSDCPLIDGELIKKNIEKYLAINDKKLFLSNTLSRQFPRGMDFEIFSFSMLELAIKNAQDPLDKEHVTRFFYTNPDQFNLLNIENSYGSFGDVRLTVDTIEDFTLISKLILEHSALNLAYNELELIVSQDKNLLSINCDVKQKLS